MAELSKDKIKEIAKIAVEALEEKKASDIKVLDIGSITVIADYFIIASGNNVNQIQAMADDVEAKLSKSGLLLKQIEGYEKAGWILMDFGDIIVHIFDNDNRLFYDLERVWKDGKEIEL